MADLVDSTVKDQNRAARVKGLVNDIVTRAGLSSPAVYAERQLHGDAGRVHNHHR